MFKTTVELLSYLPGVPFDKINLVQLALVIAQAEMKGLSLAAALQAVIDNASTIFTDPVYAAMAVKLLGLILVLVSTYDQKRIDPFVSDQTTSSDHVITIR